ncbi:flavin reductase family protein [Candidatus Nitrosocosmicus franklandus]|uniref:Flavoredoxin n=1 Tax=Candidatus Nitrosocosmicus franklandianus TaxID=1798806 RepID=A0A484IE06_9ARCH|nr:flavin reductase family protein [Candidatus Nitrosocosmicus franklandus]VFJ14309.1 Flavoredoxin [Candidatus Nitrosocosmicus franklandus]
MTEIDVAKMTSSSRYAVLTSLVVPRPIAFVTTINEDGVVNAAPFSYFNLMGNDPPVVAIGIGKDESRKYGLKDTGYNIQKTREFVINMVNEDIIEKVNLTAIDFPPEVDESEIAGLTKLPSAKVKPPRIKESASNFECRHLSTIEIGNVRVVIGEIIYLHLDEQYVTFQDGDHHILTELILPVGRMHGKDFYTRSAASLFRIARQSYNEWKNNLGKKI